VSRGATAATLATSLSTAWSLYIEAGASGGPPAAMGTMRADVASPRDRCDAVEIDCDAKLVERLGHCCPPDLRILPQMPVDATWRWHRHLGHRDGGAAAIHGQDTHA